MQRAVFLLSASLLAVCAFTPSSGAAPGKQKLRALVVTGGHAFDRQPFFALWDSFNDITWREVQHPQANDEYAPERRAAFDVIVLYDMPRTITEEQKAWLLETLKGGKPLVVLHHALCDYPDWPEWGRLVGGKYLSSRQEIDGKVWEPSTYQHDVDFTVRMADRRHPITRGLKEFTLHDEVYGGLWVSPRVHPLLKVSHPQSSEIVGWTTQYGRTRIVCLQGGHDRKAYENESYRTLVHRAVLWAARRL